MENKTCPFCGSDLKTIKQSGFVGCENCYHQIDGLQSLVRELFAGKSFSGRKPNRRGNEEL